MKRRPRINLLIRKTHGLSKLLENIWQKINNNVSDAQHVIITDTKKANHSWFAYLFTQ